MRLCVIGPSPPLRGGISAHTEQLHAALAQAGHEVRVLSYRRLYPASLFPGSSEYGSPRRLGSAVVDTLAPASWREMRALLAEMQPDLLLAQWWHPVAGPALAGAARAARTVFVCHNLRPHEPFPGWRLLTWFALSRASGFLCHSAAVAAELAAWFGNRPIECCPMPLLFDPLHGAPSRSAARRMLGLSQDAVLALFLGHLRAYKGLDLLLEAWRLAKLPARAVLLVAGESYLGRNGPRAVAAEGGLAPSVRLLDHYLSDEEMRATLAAADVLVLPYRRASQSGLLPLALAAGLKVLATRTGGLGELLDPLSGHRLVAPGDRAALAHGLEGLLAEVERGQAPRPKASGSTQADLLASWVPIVAACERLAEGGG